MSKTRKKSQKFKGLKDLYEKEYKKLFIIPILLLVLAIGQIGYQMATTGDFISKGVSLKGGMTLTVHTGDEYDLKSLRSNLLDTFPSSDFDVRTLASAGRQTAITIEADLDVEDNAQIEKFMAEVSKYVGFELNDDNSNLEAIGSSLGDSFFKDTITAVLIAFVFMGIVVFLYFRTPAPSGAVILAAFSDIVITIAIINIFNVKLSTAGIAAFLMMIGYSVDTDILLSVRVLKKKDGTVMDRIYDAMKTGLTMNLSTMAAITIALFVSQSVILKQIMLILLIGLFVDLINTWIQNVAIIRWYLEKKGNKKGSKA